ncbi:MAG TPA: BatA and WFA domain-containing protein, partial [Gemmatimonadales bacterium]|nr:BatA and WFA domain-containing protein [Gemmatimonadales bacterium]
MIAFLHPWLLLGLAAGAVPILLHRRRWREPPTVPFPAVRYLQDATREFQQRLRWRDRLLLLLRLLLLAALVFAAAGPSLPLRGAGPHAPAALALVLDNSLSSGAVAGGTPRLDALRRAATGVLAGATPGDALWLVTADGIPRRGTPGELRAIVDTLAPSPRRLDLGAAVQAAAQATAAGEGRPRGVVVLSDLQATALSPAALAVPVLVAAPGDAVVRNAGLDPLETGVQPWGVAGGRVTVRVTGDSGP